MIALPEWSTYDDRDLVTWLIERAETQPGAPALTWVPFDGPEESWSYGQLLDAVIDHAGALQERQIARGSIVGLVMDNGPHTVLHWLAVIASGASSLFVNSRSSADEIAWIAHHSGADLFLTDAAHFTVTSDSTSTPVVDVEREPLASASGRWLRPDSDPRALASIQYTSGTTSRPKGVRWTHANCLWAAEINARHQRLTSDDVCLVTLPLFHTNALAYQLLAAFEVGAHVVLQPRFSASRFWQVSIDYQCTWTGVVYFIVNALRNQGTPANHFYRGWAGSGVVHADDAPGRVPITGWFGMTETVSHPVYTDPVHVESTPPSTMGTVAPEYEVRMDNVTDNIGELLVRGVRGISLFDGYLNDPAATDQVLGADGWFRTGDRVRIENGHYFFVERMGDVLKVGGENVGAAEIERALVQVPGVHEVAVVAKPDDMLGQVPVAFVIADDSPHLKEQLQQAAEISLADFKRPREYRFVPEFPRATLNKVAKARLRDSLHELAREES
jgi:crotonobetaine/carnitine-CoA ligase